MGPGLCCSLKDAGAPKQQADKAAAGCTKPSIDSYNYINHNHKELKKIKLFKKQMMLQTKPEGSQEDRDHIVDALYRVLTQKFSPWMLSSTVPLSALKEKPPGRGTWGQTTPPELQMNCVCSFLQPRG